MEKFKAITLLGTRPKVIKLIDFIHKIYKLELTKHFLLKVKQNNYYEFFEMLLKDFILQKHYPSLTILTNYNYNSRPEERNNSIKPFLYWLIRESSY